MYQKKGTLGRPIPAGARPIVFAGNYDQRGLLIDVALRAIEHVHLAQRINVKVLK